MHCEPSSFANCSYNTICSKIRLPVLYNVKQIYSEPRVYEQATGKEKTISLAKNISCSHIFDVFKHDFRKPIILTAKVDFFSRLETILLAFASIVMKTFIFRSSDMEEQFLYTASRVLVILKSYPMKRIF